MNTKSLKSIGAAAVLAAFIGVQTNVDAAGSTTAKSDGTVNFTVPTDLAEVIKPGTDNPILIDGEQTQQDGVQLLHVPSFNFGTNALTPTDGLYSAIYENYKEKPAGSVSYAIPHFIEVGDFSADVGTNWNVKVEQDTLFKSSVDSHQLENTRIQIMNQTLHNNLKDSASLDMITGLALSAQGVNIPVAGKDGGAISVMTSKASKLASSSTQGTISSVVFKKNYQESEYGPMGTAAPLLTDKNEDVKLSVPKTDTARAKGYSTKLTWTLTVEP